VTEAQGRGNCEFDTGGLSVLGKTVLQQTTQGESDPCDVALGMATPATRVSAQQQPASATPLDSATKILPRPFRR
jgi:hypothetical protein